MMALVQLSASTVRLLGSSQVITSIYSVVKELVENSLDAGATSIDIKLENYGFDKIEVRDNGCGVTTTDAELMAKPHYTSKLGATADLESISTYGFRGEALGSLCAVSNVSITTKTASDQVSFIYNLGPKGDVVQKKPSHLGQGTTVSASHLFKNLPVRRQYYNTVKKKREMMKQVEDLVIAFSAVRHDVRFVLRHNKDVIFTSAPAADVRSVLVRVLGTSAMAAMQQLHKQSLEAPEVNVEAFLPCPGASVSLTSRTQPDRSFLYVNSRPVSLRPVEKVVKQAYCSAFGCENKYPLSYIHIRVPKKEIDVNVDPNKTQILLHCQDEVVEFLQCLLNDLYKPTPDKDQSESKLEDGDDGFCDITDEEIVQYGSTQAVQKHRGWNTDKGHEQMSKEIRDGTEIECANFGKPNDKIRKNSQVDTILQEVHNRGKSMDGVTEGSVEKCEMVRNHCVSNNRQLNVVLHKETDAMEADMAMFGKLNDGLTSTQVSDGRPNGSVRGEILSPIEMDRTSRAAMVARVVDNIYSCEKSCGSLITNDSADVNDENENGLKRIGNHEVTTKEAVYFEEPMRNMAANHPQHSNGRLELDITREVIRTNDDESIGPIQGNISSFECAIPNFSLDHSSQDLKVLEKLDKCVAETEAPGLQQPGEQTTADLWTRGVGLKSSSTLVQPVKLLQPGSCSKKVSNFLNKSARSIASDQDQPSLFAVAGLGSGFLNFSREVRPQLVLSRQELSLGEISREVRQRWAALSEAERAEYEREPAPTTASTVPRTKKSSRLDKAHSALSTASKKRKIDGNQSIEKLFTSPGGGKEAPPVKTVTVKYNVLDLQRRMKEKPNISERWLRGTGHSLQLIGQLAEHFVWLCLYDNKVSAFQPIRAQEELLYQRLLRNHILPVDTLERPIALSEKSLGRDLWLTLLKLNFDPASCSLDPFRYCTDSRLVANGLRIKAITGSGQLPEQVELEGVTSCINYYGMHDLQHILKIIASNSSASVAETRPQKVMHYLQGEAVRMSRSLPPRCSQDDATVIWQQTRKLHGTSKSANTNCFHGKSYLVTLYNLDCLPQTQQMSQLSQE